MTGKTTDVAKIRAQIKHPIVDGDGHWVESVPVLIDYVSQVAGPKMAEAYAKFCTGHRKWYDATDEERKQQRIRRAAWWLSPTDTYDRATIMMPALLKSRMDELGIDYAMMYPSIGLNIHRTPGEDMRKAVVRAFNIMTRDTFEGHGDRFGAVGVIAPITPQEAIDEARFLRNELGLKAIMTVGAFPRVVPAFADKSGEEASVNSAYYMRPEHRPYYIEALGLDNQYDYDPLWQTYVDLGVAVTAHGGSRDWVDRMSWSNDVYNHIDHFANGNHTFAKAVFLGGVVKRFPTLNFAFLEGGMGWGTSLCCDLQGHWEKRNWAAMKKALDPKNLNEAEMKKLILQYGGPKMKENADAILKSIEWNKYQADSKYLSERETEHFDDFAHLGPVTSKREIRELYSRNFYFGCEADDPTTMFAFDPRMKTRLKAMFSSDIGHWDVHHINDVLPEVYEALEDGHLTEQDFREFTFSNVVGLHGKMNADFFKGTKVEKEAGAELAKIKAADAARSESAKPARAA